MERYEFVIEPWTWEGTHGGQERVLKIKVTYNGTVYSEQNIMPAIAPFVSELEWATNRAVTTLKSLWGGGNVAE